MLDIQDKKPWRIDKHTHGHISGDTSHIKPVIPVGHHWMSLRVRGKKSYEKILFGCQSWLFHHDSNSWHNMKCWIKATFQLPKYFKNLFQPYTADQSGKICTNGWKNAFKSVKQYLHTLWSYHFKLEKFSNLGHSFLSGVNVYLLSSLYKNFTKTVKGTIALLGHDFEVVTLFCKVPGHFLWQIPQKLDNSLRLITM